MEEERLSRWHAAKLADYRKSVSAYRAFKEAYGKRQRKHEEVRDHVSKELNSQFNRYSPSSPEAQTDFIHSPAHSRSNSSIKSPVVANQIALAAS